LAEIFRKVRLFLSQFRVCGILELIGNFRDEHLDADPEPNFRIVRQDTKFVSKVTEKVKDGFSRNFQGKLDLTQLKGD